MLSRYCFFGLFWPIVSPHFWVFMLLSFFLFIKLTARQQFSLVLLMLTITTIGIRDCEGEGRVHKWEGEGGVQPRQTPAVVPL